MLALAAAALMVAAGGCSEPRRFHPGGGKGSARGFMADAPMGELELLAARDSVENPDRPVYPAGAVSARRVWELAGAEWEDPVRIALSPERVFVLDAGARAIPTVSRDGRTGPRADRYVGIRGPVSIAWSDGLLAVGDTAYHHVVIFEEFGPQRRTMPAGDLAAVAAAGHRRFALTDFGGETHRWNMVAEFQPDDGAFILEPPAAGGGDECGRVSGGRRIILADCRVPSFRVYDLAGWGMRRVAIDRAPPPFDAGRAARLNQQVMEREAAGDSAGARVLTDSLAAMDGGPRPVRGVRFDEGAGRFAVWSDAPGTAGARLDFPARWLDFAMDGGVVYALERRADGQGWLAAYAIHLPGGAPVLPASRADTLVTVPAPLVAAP